jgi:LynF/TruF/PatF family peptide O-prenyltransferase
LNHRNLFGGFYKNLLPAQQLLRKKTMALNSSIQQINLRERRLQFIRTHLDAFDVEPTFPIPLFEEAVLEIEGSCGIESSCKVENDRLLAGCFDVSNYGDVSWPGSLKYALKFLDRVESRVNVKFNRDFLQQFAALHINSIKILDSSLGLHLDPKIENSVVRICIHIKPEQDPEELVRTVISLDGSQYSLELLQVLLKDTIIIGFNLFLNGCSDVELIAGDLGKEYRGKSQRGRAFTAYAIKNFSKKVMDIYQASDIFYVSFYKTGDNPCLYFQFNDIKELKKQFSFNSLGDRIYGFCQNQDCIAYAAVGVKEKDLESSRLENFHFSYNQHDGCHPHP